MADIEESQQPAYAHPGAAVFNLAFKVAAFTMYILSGLFGFGFITDFVVCVVLLMLDFWTVKNVTGRLLVGLRWWNEVTDEGSNWRFEVLEEGQREINKKDAAIFWWCLYITPVLWLVLGLVAILKFSFAYLLVIAVAVVLNGANVMGFTKCSKQAKQRIQDFARNTVTQGLSRMF